MRFTTRSLRGCLSGCLAAALCAFALAGVAPTSAADIAGTQATGNYEITIHADETVDNVMTLTVDNMPEEQFSAFCTQTSFLSSGGYPTDVEQIEKDGKPACKVSNTGVPLDEVSQLSMTITHSGGQFDFSTMVSGEVRVATVTVTFPGRVTNANESGVTDGNSVTWTELKDSTRIEAAGKDSPGSPWPWIIAGVAAVVVVVAVAVTAVIILTRRRRRPSTGGPDVIYGQPGAPLSGQQPNQPGPPQQPGYNQPGPPQQPGRPDGGYGGPQPPDQQPYGANGQY